MTIEEATERYSEMSLNDAMESRMAWGKYAGRELGSVSLNYLMWVVQNIHPLQNGAGRVYQMIFACRKICSDIRLPDAMPIKQKYSATPSDIIYWKENESAMPYKAVPQKGGYKIVEQARQEVEPPSWYKRKQA
jgi:uncharacterized protein (DUF3820 family)